MNRLSLLAAFVALTAMAQQPPPANKDPEKSSEPVAARVELRAREEARSSAAPRGPKVSGALIQATRVDNPAQLINPRAPLRYGNGYDNVSIDPVTGRAQGIKLFVVSF